MSSIGKESYQIYYALVKRAEYEQPLLGSPSELYTVYALSFDLDRELGGLRNGGHVYDVGASSGAAVEGLAQSGKYANCDFFAITPFLLEEGRREARTVPYLEGTLESLPSEVRGQLESKNAYPPQVIIARNVLRIILEGEKAGVASGLLSLALIGMHDALPTGGFGLIYDKDGDVTYPIYQESIQNQGLHFHIEQRPNKILPAQKICPAYLHLQKTSDFIRGTTGLNLRRVNVSRI